jgi:hypothetical protein
MHIVHPAAAGVAIHVVSAARADALGEALQRIILRQPGAEMIAFSVCFSLTFRSMRPMIDG